MTVSVKSILFCGAALAASYSAQAHVPYLYPASFEPVRGGWVSLDAAFADRFFLPEAVFDNSQFVVRQKVLSRWHTFRPLHGLKLMSAKAHPIRPPLLPQTKHWSWHS